MQDIIIDEHGFKYYDNSHMQTDKKQFCMICNRPTDRLDVICEGYLCSEECDKEFYKMCEEQEQI